MPTLHTFAIVKSQNMQHCIIPAKRFIIFSLLLVLFAKQTFAQQPNILFVIADDIGLDPVPNYLPGPIKASMPNLQNLMNAGLTFDNVWANPVCAPTRASIITGQYAYRTNVLNAGLLSVLPDSSITIHKYLDSIGSGYSTSLIGKWHIGGNNAAPTHPNEMGVPYYAGTLMGAVPYNTWPLVINGTQTISTEYITTKITDMAIDWIDQQNNPWFCWVAYTAPHTPFHLPPQNMHNQGNLSSNPIDISTNPLPYYLAMVESMDYELGRLIGSLTPGELANTVIIFIGDNGTATQVIQQPIDSTHAKGSLYEGGVRVPLVISGYGVNRQGQRESALINCTDLFSTIIELTGNSLPIYGDSRSFLPALSSSGLTFRECLRSDVQLTPVTGGYAIRNSEFKLINNLDSTQEFYDLVSDPFEQNNLLDSILNSTQQAAFIQLSSGCENNYNLPNAVIENPVTVGKYVIYPNPTDNFISISGLLNEVVSYSIYSLNGVLIFSGTISGNNNLINTSLLNNGSYILRINDENIKIIKH